MDKRPVFFLNIRNDTGVTAKRNNQPGTIKPVTPDDIPQIAGLVKTTFSWSANLTIDFISDAFEEILFNNPWNDGNQSSLVYRHSDGTVKGFLGMCPRRMLFRDQPVNVYITHNFVVEPGNHAFLTGIKMFRTAMEGSQDLMISGSASDKSRNFIEKSGGTIAYQNSLYWKLPLRPLQSGLQYCTKQNKRSFARAFRLLKPAAVAGDSLLGHIFGKPFRYHRPGGQIKNLPAPELLDCLNQFSGKKAFRPAYSLPTLQWVLDTAARASHLGQLRTIGVFDNNDRMSGWFTVFLNPGGTSEVLQLKAFENREQQVFDMLTYYVRQNGGVDVTGRLEPEFYRPVSQSWALYRPGKTWQLLHGKRTDIISAICRGDAFISRLEDDLWLV